MKKYIPNTVPGSRRGAKYPETVRTAALMELLCDTNIHAVAKRYGVPESTLRGWLKKEQESPDGQESIWTRARREEIKRITARAAQDASRTLDLMRRRVETGRRNLERVEQIDALLLGDDQAEGLVTDAAGVVIGELRERKELTPDLAGRLREERAQRMQNIPADFTLSNYARTLMQVSGRGAAEQRETQGGQSGLEQLLKELQGEEF